VPGLVAIDLPGGAAFVEAVRRVWDRGDAVFPLDRRLPPASRSSSLATVAPTSILDATGEHRLDAGRPVEVGDALVVTTSGSSGTPKAAVITHAAVTAAAVATSERLAVTSGDRWLCCLPLAHVGGFGVLSRALITGTPLTVHDGFDAATVQRAAADGCTLVSLVATALSRIDPAVFRTILLGGGRPPAHRPPNAIATYGLTETGGGIVYDGSPLPGVSLAIAEPDTDGEGEVLIRSATSLRTYRDGSTPIDAEGWLHTDDLGRILDDGRLQVIGRRGDVIVTGGEKVWPEPVEDVIRGIVGVADVIVLGVDDRDWGQRVVAAIVPASGTDAPSLDTVRGHVRAHLPPFAAPKAVHVFESLPRTSLGKPRRGLLRTMIDPHSHPRWDAPEDGPGAN
jgi:o-succinylbenzoate---CoA ligase